MTQTKRKSTEKHTWTPRVCRSRRAHLPFLSILSISKTKKKHNTHTPLPNVEWDKTTRKSGENWKTNANRQYGHNLLLNKRSKRVERPDRSHELIGFTHPVWNGLLWWNLFPSFVFFLNYPQVLKKNCSRRNWPFGGVFLLGFYACFPICACITFAFFKYHNFCYELGNDRNNTKEQVSTLRSACETHIRNSLSEPPFFLPFAFLPVL